MTGNHKQWSTDKRVNLRRVDWDFFADYLRFYFYDDPRLLSIGADMDEGGAKRILFERFEPHGGCSRDIFFRLCGAMKINPEKFYFDSLWGVDGVTISDGRTALLKRTGHFKSTADVRAYWTTHKRIANRRSVLPDKSQER